MKKYKVIGILGGMGPESTACLYLKIIKIFQEKYRAVYDSDFPEMIILNVPIPDVVENPKKRNKTKKMLITAVRKIERSGADFIAIPCNTVTSYISEMQNAITIPLLNIVEETKKIIESDGLKKVGLLATELTIKNKIYEEDDKIEIVTVGESSQKIITQIIMNILQGKKDEKDKIQLSKYIAELQCLGAEKIILGCTDLPLLIKNDERCIDTIKILADAVVREATK